MASTMHMEHEHVAVEEHDSLLFQLCFYYGVLVVLVEVVVPLLFQRRLRLVLPNVLALALAPHPLPDDAFAQQKAQLSAQLRELQRATSTAKKKKRSRKTPDALRLSSAKAASNERPASAVRALKQSGGKRRSAGKSADASSSTTAARVSSHESHLHYSTDATDSTTVDSRDSSSRASLQPSQLQQPRSFFASSSTSVASSTSSSTVHSTELKQATATVSTASAASAQASSSKHQSLLKRRSAGDRAKTVALYALSASRHVQCELRRQAHEANETERNDDDDAVCNERLASSHLQSSVDRHVQQSSASSASSTSHSTRQTSERTTATMRMAPVLSEGADRRALFDDHDAADEDGEETKESEVFVTSGVDAPTHRSIGRFLPSHRESLFDDSDEEFLSVIRRPRSPVRLAPRRLGASAGNEQMDVERTIAAAFGGRPLGVAAAPVDHYQPVAAPAPPAPAAPSVYQHHHQVNMYEQQQQSHEQQQQRAQFITGRHDSPAMRTSLRTHQHTAFGASTNYREVPRDRTPRIIRRIAFDEEMMALAMTPDARSARTTNDNEYDDSAAGEKRKRSVIFSPEDEAPDFSRRRTRL